MLWAKKMPFISLLRFDQNKARNNAFYFFNEKETLFDLKNRIFQSPKNCIFFNGVNPCFWLKNANFFFA